AGGGLRLLQQVLLRRNLRFGIYRLRIERGLLGDRLAVRRQPVVAVRRREYEAPRVGRFGQIEYPLDRLDVVAPRHLFTNGLASWKPDNGREVDNRVVRIPNPMKHSRVTDVTFGKVKIGMSEVGEERLTTEEEVVDNRDVVAAPQQQPCEQ